MEKMVEPDRTIMIVSIIGLVIIWGSVLYHKFVQGGTRDESKDLTPSENEPLEVAPQSEVTGMDDRSKTIKSKKKSKKNR